MHTKLKYIQGGRSYSRPITALAFHVELTRRWIFGEVHVKYDVGYSVGLCILCVGYGVGSTQMYKLGFSVSHHASCFGINQEIFLLRSHERLINVS